MIYLTYQDHPEVALWISQSKYYLETLADFLIFIYTLTSTAKRADLNMNMIYHIKIYWDTSKSMLFDYSLLYFAGFLRGCVCVCVGVGGEE